MAATIVAAALALNSCDPTALIVKDNSALERITIQVNNDTQKWEYGEERLFTIVPIPNTATVSEYKLQFSNPDIVSCKQGELPNQFKVTADGELLNPEGVALLCTLSNGRYVGGSFKCAPLAELNDGYMEVCLVKTISRLRFVSLIGVYTKGEHINNDKFKDIIVYRRAKKVEVEAPEGFAFSLDGEIVYTTHFTVEIVPAALRLAVPE